MKKILFFTVAAATVMALTGCSQSSDLADTEVTTQTPVSFDTYLAKTRAGALGSQTTGTLMTNGFGVFAYYTTSDYKAGSTIPNFMYNTKVIGSTTGTPTTWKYTPLRYWPNNDGKISFFAYAPYVGVNSDGQPNISTDTNSYGITGLTKNSVSDAPSISYDLGTDVTNSVDLLRGVKKGDNSKTNINLTRTDNIVGFTFKHALAKFNIKAKTVSAIDASTKVTIESIKITDSNNLSQTGTLNLVDGSWSNYGGKVLLTIGNTNINTNFAESLAREIQNTTDLATFEKIAGLKTDAQSVMIGDKSCYFIPTSKPSMTIEVTYWVRTLDNNLRYGVTSEGSSNTIKKTITFTNDFQSNKQYSLTLNIGLKSITFDAEVSNWDTEVATNPDAVDISVK